MTRRHPEFRTVRLSLCELVGREYGDAVLRARAAIGGGSKEKVRAALHEKVDFYPPAFQERIRRLLPLVGRRVTAPLRSSSRGATSRNFEAATRTAMAPLTGLGLFRVGEDGRLYMITKSEHYHAPLGHSFPGYRLIENARALGIPNATHNNTRGHITRLLEEELIRAANGIAPDDGRPLDAIIRRSRLDTINRVLNLETGSLALEAAIKMALSRFYKAQEDSPEPKYRGRIPVMVVIGDDEGGLGANYHGTTMIAQTLRGMWPRMRDAFEKHAVLKVRAVPPNDMKALESVFRKHETATQKIAGFFHELVLMNYGGIKLRKEFVRRAYALCKVNDVPTIVDEIQSCLWAPELFLFREYGIRPTFVTVGKGFPGGEYPASRIIFSSAMDCLPQFGALVTNGQEELASLACLITMRWARANAEVTRAIGDYYEARLRELGDAYPRHIAAVEGSRHLSGLHFRDLASARAFVAGLVEAGFDISVQTYKEKCPPAALTKLPLIAGYDAVDLFLNRMEEVLKTLGRRRRDA